MQGGGPHGKGSLGIFAKLFNYSDYDHHCYMGVSVVEEKKGFEELQDRTVF